MTTRDTKRRPSQPIAYTRFFPGRHEVWVTRMDGSGKRRLADGRRPVISPDGRWVAFEGGRERYPQAPKKLDGPKKTRVRARAGHRGPCSTKVGVRPARTAPRIGGVDENGRFRVPARFVAPHRGVLTRRARRCVFRPGIGGSQIEVAAMSLAPRVR